MTFRRKIFFIIFFLALIGGGYFWYKGKTTTPMTSNMRMVKVETGSLSSTIKANGNISAMEESTLAFARDGIVSAIYKNEGESVKTGDIIAEIDAGTADLDLESAQRSLSDAQASYDELYTSIKESDIVKAKATLEESEATLKVMDAEYLNLLQSQKDALLEAEENRVLLEEKVKLAISELEYTQKNIATDTDTNTLEKDIASAWLSVEALDRDLPDILSDIEDIAYLDNKGSEKYGDISAKNTTLKAKTDLLYSEILTELSQYQTGVINIRNAGTKTQFDTVNRMIIDGKNLIAQFSELTSLILEELDATPAGVVWSSDTIDTAKADTKTIATTLSTKISSINTTYLTLKDYGSDDLQALSDKNTLTTKEQSVASTKNNLLKAQRDIESLKKEQEVKKVTSQNDLIRQKNMITQNTFSYNELLAGPENAEIRSAKSKIESAKIALKKAQEGMKDYQIIASFDGTVEDIPWKVGESAETSEGVLLANKDTYKIELSLDQIDIVKVQEGMKAGVVLDAFPKNIFTGSVISISATPTITSGVVSYTAIIGVSLSGVNVMSSMSATVNIYITNKENIILIPSSAIVSEGGKSYVQIASGRGPTSTSTKREVVIGSITDGKTEVSSGLTVGETITYTMLTFSGSTQKSSTTNQRSSTNNTMGGMGGPPGGF